MASKKGTKMGLGDFMKQSGGTHQDVALPSGPREKIAGSDDRWGDRRHVHDRSDRPDRERRDRDEDMGPSRADSADAWRRNGPGADSRDDRGPRRDRPFGTDDRRDRPFGNDDRPSFRSEDASAWRRDGPRESGDSRQGNFQRPSGDRMRDRDNDSQHSSDRDVRAGPRADETDDWRANAGKAADSAQPTSTRFGPRDSPSGDRDRGAPGGPGFRSANSFGNRDSFAPRDRDSNSFGSRFGPGRDDRDNSSFRRDDRDSNFRRDDRDSGFRSRDEPSDDDRGSRWRGSNDVRRDDRGPISRPGAADETDRWRRDADDSAKPNDNPKQGTDAPSDAQPSASQDAPAGDAKAAVESAPAPAAAAVEPEKKPEYKPLKTKKLEPGQKLNPFGAALPPVPKDEVQPKPVPRSSDSGASTSGSSSLAALAARVSAGDSSSGARFAARRESPSSAASSRPDPSLVGRRPLNLTSSASAAAAAAAKVDIDAQKPSAPAAPRAFDASLGAAAPDAKALNAKDVKKVPLYKAMEKATNVTLDELVDGMAKLDLQLATVSVQKELATVVARSLWDKKFTLDQVVKAITDKLGAHRSAVFTAALEWFKTKTNEAKLIELVKSSGVDITTVLDSFSKDLACLAPQSGVAVDVAAGLAADRSADDVIKIIRNECDAKVDISFLAPTVTGSVFQKAFTDKSTVNLDVVEKYAPLIKLVTSSKASQMDAIVAAHGAWFTAGMPKGAVKSLFEKLLSSKLVSAEAFMAWRDDLQTKKAAGKQQALLNVAGFLSEVVEPSLKQSHAADDDDDEEDGDEDLDAEYLVNHNR